MTKLELIDARIKEVESTLVYLLHERLALVSGGCEHNWLPYKHAAVGHSSEVSWCCGRCGKVVEK